MKPRFAVAEFAEGWRVVEVVGVLSQSIVLDGRVLFPAGSELTITWPGVYESAVSARNALKEAS